MRAVIDRLFASTFGYRYLRGLFHFGVRLAPLRRALALQAGDRVLDVGCGTGDYAPLVDRADCSYLGLDFTESYVAEARRLYGTPYRWFEVGDVRTMAFAPGSFTKALLIGVMHHLTDEENLGVLRALNDVVLAYPDVGRDGRDVAVPLRSLAEARRGFEARLALRWTEP